MLSIVYLIPVVACLVLHFGFGYRGEWPAYVWVFVLGEAAAAVGHRLFYRRYIRCREYLGSIVVSVHHEDAWTEIIIRHETRTDSKGRTYTVTRTEYRRHPEEYYLYTSLGTKISCTGDYYDYVGTLWAVPEQHDVWRGSNIRGGARYGQHYEFAHLEESERYNSKNWLPITEIGKYVNKIRHSNSIFRYERIKKETAVYLGLYDYPDVVDCDAPCILSADFAVPDDVDEMFRKFNAFYAPAVEMRLFVLLFDASKGIGVSEMQRAYWQGGNKNEFVVCIGLARDYTVEWARAFSWADYQDKEIAAARWLMEHPDMPWHKFYDWLVRNIDGWKRKEFSDFGYIHITLPLWQGLIVALATALVSSLVIYVVLSYFS